MPKTAPKKSTKPPTIKKKGHTYLSAPRIEHVLRDKHGRRMGKAAAMRATLFCEFLMKNAILKAADIAQQKNRQRISKVHLQRALVDQELRPVLPNVNLCDAGITTQALPPAPQSEKNKEKRRKAAQAKRRREKRLEKKAAEEAAVDEE